MARKKPVRVPPATADRLVSGWAGPGGTHIRLARHGDTERITGLLALAGIPLDPVVGAVIEAGTVASTLLLGLDHGPEGMLRPLAEAVAAHRPDERAGVGAGRGGSGRVSCAGYCKPFRPTVP